MARTPLHGTKEETGAAAIVADDRLTLEKAQRKLVEVTTEYRDLRNDDSPSAVSRRLALKGQMRALAQWIGQNEPKVVVTIPRSVRGEPFDLNGKKFHGGQTYTVTTGEAQMLLYMADQDRRAETRLYQSGGRTFDLGTIGEKARMQVILAEAP